MALLTTAAFSVPTVAHSRRWLPAVTILVLLVLAGLGLYARHVFTTAPAPVAVTTAAGVAQFNFRVTGIPVPGVVAGLRANVQLDPAALGGTHGIITAELHMLSTGLALRDQHAKVYLGAAAHPTATFTLNRLEGLFSIVPGQQQRGFAHGTLRLNGVARAVKAPLELDFTYPNGLDVAAHFNVAFKDYGIDIPGADGATDVTAKFRLPVQP